MTDDGRRFGKGREFGARALQRLRAPRLRHAVRVFDPNDVTTTSEREEPAAAGGLDQEQIETIWRSVRTLYRSGIQPAISLCIRRHGRIILDRSIGHAQGNSPGDGPQVEKELATPDHLYNLFSGSKPITAMLMHHLDDEGLLHIDDAVAEYIPKFTSHGKDRITIRHLLTHTAGIPTTHGMMNLDYLRQPERIREYYCSIKPRTRAGHRLAYHALSSGFIFKDIIREVTGKSIQTLHRELVREPLGFDNLAYGVPEEKLPLVARDAYTGFGQLPPASTIFERGFGTSMPDIVRMAVDERYLTAVVPSGNIIGRPEEIGRYFELLLRGGKLDGHRVFQERTVRRATKKTTTGQIDGVIMLPIPYAAGFMLGGKLFSLYGAGTESAFGHLGFTNICAWADPQRDISVALMTTGKPLVTPELLAWLNVPYTISRVIPDV